MLPFNTKDDPIYALWTQHGALWGYRYSEPAAQAVADQHEGMTYERLVPASELEEAETDSKLLGEALASEQAKTQSLQSRLDAGLELARSIAASTGFVRAQELVDFLSDKNTVEK